MTQDELRAQFGVLYKTLTRELRWRERVFPEGHPQREEKLREIKRALEIVDGWKDELKELLPKSYEQPPLLDVPPRTQYR